jgi:signal transduction histidine kinase
VARRTPTVIEAPEDLQTGFRQFVAAARELERSYVELKARAEAVDLQLQATNRALQQALDEREAIFAALPIGVVKVRADGTVAAANREAQRLRAAGDAAANDLLRRPDGDVAFGEAAVRVTGVDLPDGRLVVLEDRSRVQALEQKVHRLDRLAGLSELALGIAHEIKNPLNGVMGFAALMERSKDTDAMRRFAGKVVQGVREVDGIVKALLGFARPAEKSSRTATVAEIAADAATAAGLPRVRLRLEGAIEQRCDADALTRVLVNLFQNAIEAAPTTNLRVAVARRADQLELIVEDDGPGVPARLGEAVFEPFVSSKERGTGLGLPLSARVLGFLGGELALLNPGERGARFCVRLPAAVEAAVAAPATRPAEEASA